MLEKRGSGHAARLLVSASMMSSTSRKVLSTSRECKSNWGTKCQKRQLGSLSCQSGWTVPVWISPSACCHIAPAAPARNWNSGPLVILKIGGGSQPFKPTIQRVILRMSVSRTQVSRPTPPTSRPPLAAGGAAQRRPGRSTRTRSPGPNLQCGANSKLTASGVEALCSFYLGCLAGAGPKPALQINTRALEELAVFWRPKPCQRASQSADGKPTRDVACDAPRPRHHLLNTRLSLSPEKATRTETWKQKLVPRTCLQARYAPSRSSYALSVARRMSKHSQTAFHECRASPNGFRVHSPRQVSRIEINCKLSAHTHTHTFNTFTQVRP